MVAAPGGNVTSTGGYTYAAPPTIGTVTPSSGPNSGGTSVTISGSSFTGATVVTFGGVAATSFTVNSATQITGQQGEAAQQLDRQAEVGERGAADARAIEREPAAEHLLVHPADRLEQPQVRTAQPLASAIAISTGVRGSRHLVHRMAQAGTKRPSALVCRTAASASASSRLRRLAARHPTPPPAAARRAGSARSPR